MSGLEMNAAQAPCLLVGVVVGVLAFSELLIVLVPVLRRRRRASLARGFLGVGASFATLLAGVAVVHRFFEGALLAFLAGELVGMFACWTILAYVTVTRKRGK